MIASFGDDDTDDFYNEVVSAGTRKWTSIEAVAFRKLDMLDAASKLDDLRVPPGNRLERLKGNLARFHSIRINKQWRIVFEWKDGAPHQVKITDYH